MEKQIALYLDIGNIARERPIVDNNNNNKSAVKNACKQERTMYCSSETATTHLSEKWKGMSHSLSFALILILCDLEEHCGSSRRFRV